MVSDELQHVHQAQYLDIILIVELETRMFGSRFESCSEDDC